MNDDTNVNIKIHVSDDSKAAIDNARRAFGSLWKDVGQQMVSVGSDLSKYVSLPLAGVATAAAKSAIDFQQAMTYIRTDAGDTTDNIQKLSGAVLDLAKHSQFNADELAQGLYHIASLGLRGSEALKALNTAQQMASVGGADLESTASALGGALVTGIKGIQDYTKAAGILDATVGAGNMRMQDLVAAIGTGVLPVFKNAGLSITDFGAALATLTDNGMGADEAATRLRMTVSLMEAPSKKAAGALEAIGLKSDDLAKDMQTKGLIPALQDLQKHLVDTYGTTAEGKVKIAQTLTEAFGGGRSSAAIQTLVDQLDRVQNKYSQINQQGGEFNKKVLEQQSTSAAQFKMAMDAMNADLIKLGADILPTVVHGLHDLTNWVNNASDWFEHLSSGQRHFIIVAGGVVAAIGPILVVLGTLAKSLSNIISLTSTVGNGIRGLSALAGSPAALAGWGILAAGVVADLHLIVKAVQTVQGAINALDQAHNATINDNASIDAAHQQLVDLSKHGTAAQQARAKKLLAAGVAMHRAMGGPVSANEPYIVGEHGMELFVPNSSGTIVPNQQVTHHNYNGGNSSTVTIQQVVLNTPAAVAKFFESINQDTLSVGSGLSAVQGQY